MNLLILGGSIFVGRAFASTAVELGHTVTVFNRGHSGEDPPGVTPVRGDRERRRDLRRLVEAGPWDAVIDSAGYVPALVAMSARELAGHAGAYVFVSSVSALRDWPTRPVHAGSAAFACDPDSLEIDYGPAKAGCERAVAQYFGGPRVVLRCGILLGPHENIGRLPLWLDRMARGGRVLAPGDPAVPMQVADVRDVARFGIDCASTGCWGTHLVAGPRAAITYGQWLETCRRVTASSAAIDWVDDRFLLERGVLPWTELPLWAPSDAGFDAAWDVDTDPTAAAGYTARPVATTVADTWAWMCAARAAGASVSTTLTGLDPAREARLLAAWSDRAGLRTTAGHPAGR